jgi:hypothetical protein
MSATVRIRGVLVAALLALTCALAAPVIDHANAEPSAGGGKVTCPSGGMGGDGEPGDVHTVHTYTYLNGNLVVKSTWSMICGDDGKWHFVAQFTVPPGQAFPVLSAPALTLK